MEDRQLRRVTSLARMYSLALVTQFVLPLI
jgi:hypothetical protein